MAAADAGVSADAIRWAYRMFLGREPSPREAAVWAGTRSLGELRAAFLSSSEFKANQPATVCERLGFDLPAAAIDWSADAGAASRLLDRVRTTWTAIGESRPHWSVLSSDQFLPEALAENETAFYQSGGADLARLISVLQRHQVPHPSHVLEYGCGLGRVTRHLAGKFPRVTACDISSSHLALARRILAGCGNVTLKRVEDRTFAMTEPFDLWISYIVLQHNPPPIIAMILRRMFEMLAPGGLAVFQVPTYCVDYRFDIAEYLLRGTPEEEIEVHCLPQPVVFRLAREGGCVPLEVREDDAMGPASHWLSNTFVFRKPKHL